MSPLDYRDSVWRSQASLSLPLTCCSLLNSQVAVHPLPLVLSSMENVDGKRKPSGGLVNNYLFKKAIKHSYACIDIVYDASDNDHFITGTF